ncbi:MAG: threonine--tRNA ligase [bacterium]|nr:threonine--tRNA ligase [bacterium]
MDENYSPINLRHSLAHLLGAAVLELYPGSKLAIGPSIDNGFYYDIEVIGKISDDDLPRVEVEMRKILKSWEKFEAIKETEESAKARYVGNPYKKELIEEVAQKGEEITSYKSGRFIDLCRGGHVQSAKDMNPDAFKLSHVAGAYWRGDEKNQMLTRIYGLAFETKKELDEHITMLEEAKKRDHKKLGSELDLFMFHHTAPGMPYWLPKGVVLYNELVQFWRTEHSQRGYQEIVSPILNKKELYVMSGHYDHYWPEMFVAKMEDGEIYGIKAMNCPNAMVVFGSKPHSYRELPLRLSDTDTLHRYERSGVLQGLLRVREFRQDDAHIFVTEDQIGSEYEEIFKIVDRFYSIFGMNYWFRLGTQPENFMGDIETWNKAEKTLKEILKKSGKEYLILEGDGAFYGPKVDILMRDAIGREWQMGTIQLDFQQPKRFELEYITAEGTKKTPVAIHRVIYGSFERFIGILIEHYAGAFPVWLSPVQAIVLPITEKQNKWADEVADQLKKADIRAEINKNNETLGKKIREAEKQKSPYILIIGDKEIKAKAVSVRQRGSATERERGSTEASRPNVMKLKEFIKQIQKEIADKK